SWVTAKPSVYRHANIAIREKVGELLVVLHRERRSRSGRFGRKLVEGLVMLLLLLHSLEILCQERRLWSVRGLEGELLLVWMLWGLRLRVVARRRRNVVHLHIHLSSSFSIVIIVH